MDAPGPANRKGKRGKMFDVTPQPAGLERVRFVAADMDHTLLKEDQSLPEGLEQRIDALAELGVTFSAASGRPLYTLHDLLGHLADKIMFICDNGGLISRSGEVLYQANMPVATYHTLARACHEQGAIGLVCATDACYIEGEYERYDKCFREFYTNIAYVDDLEQVSAPADKFTVYFPENNAYERCHDIMGSVDGANFSYACGDIMWLDIMPAGINKGSAMRRVSELLGLGLDEMCAFGDAANDAEMIDEVGFGYVMANAGEVMAPHAKLVAPANDECGVLQVMDQIVAARQAL